MLPTTTTSTTRCISRASVTRRHLTRCITRTQKTPRLHTTTTTRTASTATAISRFLDTAELVRRQTPSCIVIPPQQQTRDFTSSSSPPIGGGRRRRTSDVAGGIVVRKKGKGHGYCYGCGADLMGGGGGGDTNPSSSSSNDDLVRTITKKKSYWQSKKDELKKSQIKNWALCSRCKKLQQLAHQSNKNAASELAQLTPNSEMTQIFRQEVSQIRTKEQAVVVLCVDAVNVSGSLIKSIRKYVGGNPILLAVTRCDLLPPYVWQRHEDDNDHGGNNGHLESLKKVFRERAKEIIPADIFLCSEDPDYRKRTGGIQQLSDELWNHLNGRDPYVIGAANLGKSTLTDMLIARIAGRGEKAGHFGDRLGTKRLEALRRSRITKSALPGTTLQNVRVPCFRDHHQALWDTPGLLLDESLKHFPIRNFAAIRAQRPSQIQPHILETPKKSFCLLIMEQGDPLPLLRIEIRLKKTAEGDGVVRLVWNSTLNLDTKIEDIAPVIEEEKQRVHQLNEEKESRKHADQKTEEELGLSSLSPEERKQRRLRRKEEYAKKIEQEKLELGAKEWRKREAKRKAEVEERQRFRDLSRLTKVHEIIVDGNEGIDLAVANFGWLGVLVPRTARIQTYAPSSGVRVADYPTIGLPPEFGEYSRYGDKDNTKKETGGSSDEDEAGSDVDSDDDFDDVWGYDDDEWGYADDEWGLRRA